MHARIIKVMIIKVAKAERRQPDEDEILKRAELFPINESSRKAMSRTCQLGNGRCRNFDAVWPNTIIGLQRDRIDVETKNRGSRPQTFRSVESTK